MSGFTNAHLATALFLLAGVPVAWKAGRWVNEKREKPKVIFYAVVGLIATIIFALIALLAIFISSYSEQTSETPLEKPQETARLVKDPRLDWDAASGRLSLQGRYSRPGGPISVYVTYAVGWGSSIFRAPNTVLGGGNFSIEPRIKVDSFAHFDREEKTDITLGFIMEDNGLILQWGQPQQNKTKLGITFGSYFGAVVLVWNDGKNEESYPFAIIATFQKTDRPGAQQPPPIILGPDAIALIGAVK